MVQDYRVHIVDIRRIENTDLFQTDVKHVFDMIRCSENKKALLELITKNEYYKHIGGKFIKTRIFKLPNQEIQENVYYYDSI